MRRLLLLASLLLAACADRADAPTKAAMLPANTMGDEIYVVHDDYRRVTCWVFRGWHGDGGISCLPDGQFPSGTP